MSFKKIKKIVAQLVIVAFIVPNISAKAIINNPGSVIEEKSSNKETDSITNNAKSSQDNEKEDSKKDNSNGEELLTDEKDSAKDNEAQNSISNNSSDEKLQLSRVKLKVIKK